MHTDTLLHRMAMGYLTVAEDIEACRELLASEFWKESETLRNVEPLVRAQLTTKIEWLSSLSEENIKWLERNAKQPLDEWQFAAFIGYAERLVKRKGKIPGMMLPNKRGSALKRRYRKPEVLNAIEARRKQRATYWARIEREKSGS